MLRFYENGLVGQLASMPSKARVAFSTVFGMQSLASWVSVTI